MVLFQAVAQCVKEKPIYFAERLYKSMKVWLYCDHIENTAHCKLLQGLGTDDEVDHHAALTLFPL